MKSTSTLEIPSVNTAPLKLKDIIYNCPRCDYEILIDGLFDNKSFIECENCEHKISIKIKKLD